MVFRELNKKIVQFFLSLHRKAMHQKVEMLKEKSKSLPCYRGALDITQMCPKVNRNSKSKEKNRKVNQHVI